MKNYRVIELLKKYDQYNNYRLLIVTDTENFEIIFDKYNIPHLLGIQYINKQKDEYKGSQLKFFINKHQLSDQDILEKVEHYHGLKQKENVRKRIATFEYFLNNLEKSIVVEKTLETNMLINYLLIQDENTKAIKHLGICSTDNGALLVSYEDENKEIKDFFRTYFVRDDSDYYNKSHLFEKIISIQVYNEESNEYLPFSFDERKNKFLLEKYKANKNLNYQETIKEYESMTQLDKDSLDIEYNDEYEMEM